MADEVKTPGQVAHEQEEARRESQVEFDPKVHGVGTMPVTVPDSVKEMWHKHVAPLQARVKELESQVASLVTARKRGTIQ